MNIPTPRSILEQVISASFCVIFVLSNIFSAKMVELPFAAFSIPAGLIIYPLTFFLTDLMTEIFGAKRARLMVFIALGTNLLSLCLIHVVLALPTNQTENARAFQTVLGLSGLRIFSSLISYVTAQTADIWIYAAIKRWTGEKWLWLRNNGSTFMAQLVDTLMIDLIFLWWGLGMSLTEIAPIMLFSYAYKALFSIGATPLFYFLVNLIRKKPKLNIRTLP